jgi:hypothetical protein
VHQTFAKHFSFGYSGCKQRSFIFCSSSYIDNDLSWREAFTGGMGRAGIGASAALRTGITIKNLLPGKLFNISSAEGFGILIIKVNRFDCVSYRIKISKVSFGIEVNTCRCFE